MEAELVSIGVAGSASVQPNGACHEDRLVRPGVGLRHTVENLKGDASDASSGLGHGHGGDARPDAERNPKRRAVAGGGQNFGGDATHGNPDITGSKAHARDRD